MRSPKNLVEPKNKKKAAELIIAKMKLEGCQEGT